MTQAISEKTHTELNCPTEVLIAFKFLITVDCTNEELEKYKRNFTNKFMLDDGRRFHGARQPSMREV